jgi:hypothetical protein
MTVHLGRPPPEVKSGTHGGRLFTKRRTMSDNSRPHELDRIEQLQAELAAERARSEQLEREKQQHLFAEMKLACRYVTERAARKRKAEDPDRDEYFCVLHVDQGKSYQWIAQRDPIALAEAMSAEAIRHAVRRARRRRQKNS